MTQYSVKYVPTTYQSQQPAESPANEQQSGDRYSTCLNTCNSLDPKWRKHTVSKYKSCCSRSVQYDAQFEQSTADRMSEPVSKFNDDAYYNYIYRRSRSRRSRRPHRSNRANRYSSTASPVDGEENASVEKATPESDRSTSAAGRGYHYESPYLKYYKSRHSSQQDSESSREGPDSGSKYPKERYYRHGRSRDFDDDDSQQSSYEQNEDEMSAPEQSGVSRGSGYGSGAHSVESGRYPSNDQRTEDEEPRQAYDEEAEQDREPAKYDSSAEYSTEHATESGSSDEKDSETTSYKPKQQPERKRKSAKVRSRKHGKESKSSKKSRKSSSSSSSSSSRLNKQEYSAGQVNGTGYDTTQSVNEQYHQPETSTSSEEVQQQYQREKESTSGESGDVYEKENSNKSSSNKYKPSLNETAVAHLSKTTMHLKEILAILEKKAQLKYNETSAYAQQATSTPAPATTTSIYSSPIFSSQSLGVQSYSSPPYGSSSSMSSSDFSELMLKSPYRYDSMSLPSSLSQSSLSIPSTYGSLGSEFGSLSSYQSGTYGLAPPKPMPSGGPYPRKRRPNKNVRYNNHMMSKPQHPSPHSPLMQAPNGKNSLLNSPLYSMQYPYWIPRTNTLPATTAYPYKSMNKLYSSLLSGQGSSKLSSQGGLYSDEARSIHSLANYDPLANVASSLRPSSTMRLRAKPFVFQPHVLPIYTRHTILAPTLDVKK